MRTLIKITCCNTRQNITN